MRINIRTRNYFMIASTAIAVSLLTVTGVQSGELDTKASCQLVTKTLDEEVTPFIEGSVIVPNPLYEATDIVSMVYESGDDSGDTVQEAVTFAVFVENTGEPGQIAPSVISETPFSKEYDYEQGIPVRLTIYPLGYEWEYNTINCDVKIPVGDKNNTM